MKKIFAFSLAIAALFAVSCQKEKAPVAQNKTVTVNATFEPVGAADTKLTIAESGSNFALNFESTDKMSVANSSNKTVKTGEDAFVVTSFSGTTASFSGILPDVEGTTTDYFGVISSFCSATNSNIRGAIAATQEYAAGGVIANNCFLVGKEKGAEVGTMNTVSFKTLNAFLKLNLVKGSAAAGSSNDYSTAMTVTSIDVEAVEGTEVLAGRFGISKTDDSFADNDFAEVMGDYKTNKVTLNCNDAALGTTAVPFYFAIKPGTFTKGLKVTINVKDKNGKDGKFVRYISKNTSTTVARNTIVNMPDLTVNPEDVASSGKNYVKVTAAPTDWKGTYLIVFDDNMAHATVTGKDLLASTSALAITDGKIASSAAVDAAAVTIEAGSTTGSYAIKLPSGNYLGVGSKQVSSVSSKNSIYLAYKPGSDQVGHIYISSKSTIDATANIVFHQNTYFRAYADKLENTDYKLPDFYKLED